MWCIIKLRDRDETPCGTETIDGVEYYVDDMFDLEDGRIYDGFKTKKEAIEEAKEMKLVQKMSLAFGICTKKYRFIVDKEENVYM